MLKIETLLNTGQKPVHTAFELDRTHSTIYTETQCNRIDDKRCHHLTHKLTDENCANKENICYDQNRA